MGGFVKELVSSGNASFMPCCACQQLFESFLHFIFVCQWPLPVSVLPKAHGLGSMVRPVRVRSEFMVLVLHLIGLA